MKFRLIVSFLFLASRFAAFSQEKQSPIVEDHNSAVAEKGLIKVSIMYPFGEGKTFNMEYYETKHMPMVAGFLGSNLVRYTIEKGLASGIPEPTSDGFVVFKGSKASRWIHLSKNKNTLF